MRQFHYSPNLWWIHRLLPNELRKREGKRERERASDRERERERESVG